MTGQCPTDGSAEPPRGGNGGNTDDSDGCQCSDGVGGGQECTRREQPKESDAMVGRAKRTDRTEQRDFSVANPVQHRQQLVALVVIPLPAAWKTYEPEGGSQDKDRGQDEPVAPRRCHRGPPRRINLCDMRFASAPASVEPRGAPPLPPHVAIDYAKYAT